MAQLGKFEQYLVEEFYDDYREGSLSRRSFVRRVAFITGSMGAAAVAMAAVGCGDDELPAAGEAIPSAAPRETGTATGNATAAASATAATPAAAAALSPLSVAEGDPAVTARTVSFPSGAATISGYLARPAAATG